MKQNLVKLKGYVKNFKDGTITEHVKMKPMTGYRGRTTVQLFNAETGEIEQEVMSENVINNWIAKDAFDAAFRGRVNEHKTNLFANPFAYLLLSDATVPENADAKELVGRMYGYATRGTYSGNAINRGTLNTAESWYNNRTTAGKTVAHFVFDFPTHAANGTIRTIYWAPSLLECSEVTSGNMPWTGIKRCSNWSYRNYPGLYEDSTYSLEFNKQQQRSYNFIYNTSDKNGRLDMTAKMFYGLNVYSNSLQFGVIDIDRFNMSESDRVICRYSDGSAYTSFPNVMATHIDPASQTFKVLFYTGSFTSYKDMPLQYTFYEVTFNFSGATQSVKSFDRSLLVDNSRYPNRYADYYSNGWYYTDSGELRLVSYYTTPNTSPVEYENYEIQFNDTLTAITKVDIRPIIASCLNERYGVTTHTVEDPRVKQSALDFVCFVKDDVICYRIISTAFSAVPGNYIVRRSDNVCLYSSADWYANPSATFRYFYGSNTIVCVRVSGTGDRGCWFGQFTMLPSAQNLLPSDVVKTDIHTMKVQYDFIIDENNFVTDYVPNGGK